MKKEMKAWIYLLPAILFLGIFMVYPLIDVLIYSFEEGYNFASQSFEGYGLFNYSYVLHDPYFLQALKNTFIIVIITVPVSTTLAQFISLGLSKIKVLRNFFQFIGNLINGFRHDRIQNDIRTRARVAGTGRTELEFVPGERKGTCPVAVRGILRKRRQSINADLHECPVLG